VPPCLSVGTRAAAVTVAKLKSRRGKARKQECAVSGGGGGDACGGATRRRAVARVRVSAALSRREFVFVEK
jgi:hypothetical protein